MRLNSNYVIDITQYDINDSLDYNTEQVGFKVLLYNFTIHVVFDFLKFVVQ